MEQENKNKKPVKILIVDDLNINVKILENIIEAEGYEALCALSVQEALDIMKEDMPQLILSDFSMPGMDGMEFCKLLKSNPRTRDIPFIFITVADSREDKKAAFLAGAVDFIPKPFEPVEVIMRVNNQLNSYRIKQEMEDYNRMMHQMVDEQKKQMEKEWEKVLLAMANLVEKRTASSPDHLERVGHNSHILAQSLQLMPQYEDDLTDEFIETIEPASKLCNIGRLVMPASESGRDDDKQEGNRLHAEAGAQILEEIGLGSSHSDFFEMAVEIARYHHARWDGSGYPENVKGRDIPLAARITKVANDFAKLLDRQHESVERSIEIINEKSGTVYDPDIVNVFNKVWRQLKLE